MASRSTLQRILLVSLIASVLTAVLGGLHYYIARRLVLDPGVPEPWRTALLAGIVVLGLTLVAQPIAERMLRPPLSRVVSWPASLWMGFAFLILVGLAGSDGLLGLAGSVALAAPDGSGPGGTTAVARAWIVVGLAFAAGVLGLFIALRGPVVRRVEILLDRWPEALDGFRIVQLSDIHIGPILGRDFATTLVERTNALAPDLVAVTGDLVDGGVRQLRDEVAPFSGLRAHHGVYFVTGNHDHYSGASSWSEQLATLGFRVLRNETVAVGDGDASFDLVGVDDHRGNHLGSDGGEDLPAALDGRDPERPAILLAHDPSTFKKASSESIDLQLSGHTHGGQIWPFGILVRLAIPFVAGRYTRRGSELYVSRGTGFWGPPMRLMQPAEITEIVLRSASVAA